MSISSKNLILGTKKKKKKILYCRSLNAEKLEPQREISNVPDTIDKSASHKVLVIEVEAFGEKRRHKKGAVHELQNIKLNTSCVEGL